MCISSIDFHTDRLIILPNPPTVPTPRVRNLNHHVTLSPWFACPWDREFDCIFSIFTRLSLDCLHQFWRTRITLPVELSPLDKTRLSLSMGKKSLIFKFVYDSKSTKKATSIEKRILFLKYFLSCVAFTYTL